MNKFANEGWVEDLFEAFTDETVNEICLNGTRSLSLHKHTTRSLGKSPFADSVSMVRACQEFARSQGVRLDPFSPFAGGKLDKGSFRWHCLIPPACREGALFTLRRHRFRDLALEDFSMSQNVRDRLTALNGNRERHTLFCGPTGSGKTSLLLACLKSEAWEERVAIIEEVEELPLLSPHWISLVSRKPDIEGRGMITPATLIEESLRLRPDRLVVGEIRTAESLVFFEAITCGHWGSMATLHASQKIGVRERLASLVQFRRQDNAEKTFSQNRTVNNLWCVFLERGHPPNIVAVEKFQ